MKDLAIPKGIITVQETTKPESKGRYFFLTKLVRDIIKKLNVGYFDVCCPTSSVDVTSTNSYTGVRYNITTSHLEYFNGATWTAISGF